MRKTWEQPEEMWIKWLFCSFTYISQGKLILSIKGKGRITKGICQQIPYRNQIVELRISEGIREIGTDAFEGYSELKRVCLPGSIQDVKRGSFSKCGKLEEIVYTGSKDQLEQVNIRKEALPARFY